MEKGWIYVLVNASMPNMSKVGRTTRDARRRIAELSSATGVATPFVLAFDQAFDDCARAERDIHRILDERGLRVAPNREFFFGNAGDIVRIVMAYSSDCSAVTGRIEGAEAAETAAGLMARGDQLMSARSLPSAPEHFAATEHLAASAYPDMSDHLATPDYTEALRCFGEAAKAGSLLAHERLASLYLQFDGLGQAGRRAMPQLRTGALLGNYYCFAEMAKIFAAAAQAPNCLRAWNRFFEQRAAFWRSDVECEPGSQTGEHNRRFVMACRLYIGVCLAFRRPPEHLPALRPHASAILSHQHADLARLHHETAAHRRLMRILRWTYVSLTATPKVTAARPKTSLLSCAATRDHGATA